MTTIKEIAEKAEDMAEALSRVIISAANMDKHELQTAISEVLAAGNALPLPAPEGVEFDMHVFIVSPSTGAETCLHFPGNRMLPPRDTDPVDLPALIDSTGVEQSRRLRAYASDWRVMTRAEITAYKVRQIRSIHG